MLLMVCQVDVDVASMSYQIIVFAEYICVVKISSIPMNHNYFSLMPPLLIAANISLASLRSASTTQVYFITQEYAKNLT